MSPNNEVMKKTIRIFWVLLCCGVSVFAATRSSEVERVASELLFYLAANDQILTREQLEAHLARTDTSVSRLYARLEAERKDALKNKASLLKEVEAPSDQIIFKAQQIRRAALKEILSLGNGVIPILLEAVNSARQDIVMGVIRGLRELKSEEALSVLVDVLERSPSGYTRFSDRARREAIISLGEMTVHDERWKKLIQDGLTDADPKLRQLTRDVVLKIHDDWSKAQLLVAWKHELKLYQQLRSSAKQRNLQQVFDDSGVESIWVLKTLEGMLSQAILPEPVLPEELLNRFDFLRLMIQNHQVLTPELRPHVLSLGLATNQHGAIKIEALKALQLVDKLVYSKNVLSLLSLQEDPEVLEMALQRYDEWLIPGAKDIIGDLAKRYRQDHIRNLAQKILDRQI